jgi:hypothetical protein
MAPNGAPKAPLSLFSCFFVILWGTYSDWVLVVNHGCACVRCQREHAWLAGSSVGGLINLTLCTILRCFGTKRKLFLEALFRSESFLCFRAIHFFSFRIKNTKILVQSSSTMASSDGHSLFYPQWSWYLWQCCCWPWWAESLPTAKVRSIMNYGLNCATVE